MIISYLHIDGKGKAAHYPTIESFETKAFVQSVFSELDRLPNIGERISATTGEIEPIPPMPKSQERLNLEKHEGKNVASLTQAEKDEILEALFKEALTKP